MLLAFCSRSVRRPRRSACPVRPLRYRLGLEALAKFSACMDIWI
jgi:hypothetical protein